MKAKRIKVNEQTDFYWRVFPKLTDKESDGEPVISLTWGLWDNQILMKKSDATELRDELNKILG
jgi:hypothetical protein